MKRKNFKVSIEKGETEGDVTIAISTSPGRVTHTTDLSLVELSLVGETIQKYLEGKRMQIVEEEEQS